MGTHASTMNQRVFTLRDLPQDRAPSPTNDVVDGMLAESLASLERALENSTDDSDDHDGIGDVGLDNNEYWNEAGPARSLVGGYSSDERESMECVVVADRVLSPLLSARAARLMEVSSDDEEREEREENILDVVATAAFKKAAATGAAFLTVITAVGFAVHQLAERA